MIVEPDFPDHWKTQMLVTLTNDNASPLMIIRLWAFCQKRKRWILDGISPESLKAITHWDGDANLLLTHLKATGFIDEEEGVLKVHDWDAVNHQLVTNWKNGRYGKLGGRPISKVQKPIGLPLASHSQPGANPIRLDKTRLDKNREDKKEGMEEALRILEALNKEAGTNYKPVDSNTNLIRSRLSEGFTESDCVGVISMKVKEWGRDPKMSKFLRPQTIFGKEKFSGYAGQISVSAKKELTGKEIQDKMNKEYQEAIERNKNGNHA